jgi:hypothetical protein
MQKRAKQRQNKERLWLTAEHSLLASGAGAMLITGIGTEITGWPRLAAVFYIAALLLLVVVFVRTDLFRLNPKTAWGVLVVTAIFETVLWVQLQPPRSVPKLVAIVHQTTLMKGELRPNNVVVFLWVTIVNEGTAPSTAGGYSLIADVPQRGSVRLLPIYYTGEYKFQSGGADMKLNIAHENLMDRTAQPIPANGGTAAGILSFVLLDMDVEDLPKTGIPMRLLYADADRTQYSVLIPPTKMVKGSPLKIPGISGGEVIGISPPSPTPPKTER